MSSPISKDYARKPELIGDLSYPEWMKKPTFRALQWIQEQKESEFKKPYMVDDHVPMEAFPQWPPPWFPPFPPFPNFPDPVPTDPDSPWYPGEPSEEEPIEGVCPPGAWCAPGNPQTIIAGGDSVVLNVWACPPPNAMSIAIHESGFNVKTQPMFISGSGAQWAFSILAEADACGLCTIIVSCSDGSGTICYLRCDNGVWVLKGDPECVLSGAGATLTGGDTFTLISGYQKQVQRIFKVGTCNDTCENCGGDSLCECENCCNEGGSGCTGTGCDSCISFYSLWGDFVVPYVDYEGPKCNYYLNLDLLYYEWECP